MSVIGGSLIGVFANLIPAKGIYLKGTWRFGSFIFIAIIFYIFYGLFLAVRALVSPKRANSQKEDKESKRNWKEELKVCAY